MTTAILLYRIKELDRAYRLGEVTDAEYIAKYDELTTAIHLAEV